MAIAGKLHEPAVLERQVRRMLADPRSRALVDQLRRRSGCTCATSTSITPDMRLFPDFDDNLRQAFRRETELFFESVLREDRSVLDLLRADYTFVNERLAKHYGIPHVYGSRFRRVALDEDSERGGLLRQGSILTVTSYATRTSPVLRGKWVLENLLGAPPPPPLPDVPALKDNTVDGNLLGARAAGGAPRATPACAGCHKLMDPVGFVARELRRGRPLADGRRRRADRCVRRACPTAAQFAGRRRTRSRRCCGGRSCSSARLTEKLLTYALGPRRRVLRRARRSARSCATRGRRTTGSRRSSSESSRARRFR